MTCLCKSVQLLQEGCKRNRKSRFKTGSLPARPTSGCLSLASASLAAVITTFYFISIIYTYTKALDRAGALPSLEAAENPEPQGVKKG